MMLVRLHPQISSNVCEVVATRRRVDVLPKAIMRVCSAAGRAAKAQYAVDGSASLLSVGQPFASGMVRYCGVGFLRQVAECWTEAKRVDCACLT